jgi:hypothetical protein
MNKLPKNEASFLLRNKLTLILATMTVLLIGGGLFAFQKFFAQKQALVEDQQVEEIDLPFAADGPFALLFPRNDGNALVLNLKRTGLYDKISYELAYNTEGVDRGVVGDINTKDKKGEYTQEILFGTCSRNVCKYDKDVENGTLTLHIRKGKEAYRMVTGWHLQRPDIALGVLTSGDSHFTLKTDSNNNKLSMVKFTIINDLSGAPKLPEGKEVTGKIYAVNTVVGKSLPQGIVTIELADNPASDSKVARYDEAQNKWIEYDTKTEGGKLISTVDGTGAFAVLSARELRSSSKK